MKQKTKSGKSKPITLEQAQENLGKAIAAYACHPDVPREITAWFRGLIGLIQQRIEHGN